MRTHTPIRSTAPAGALDQAGTAPSSSTGRRLGALFGAALATTALFSTALVGAATPALAHDELVGIAGALNPEGTRIALTLSFNNEIMDLGAETAVTGENAVDLADGEPTVSGRDVTQSIIMPGFDETITVAWRVTSSDGHPISNTTAFAVVERDGGTELEFRDVPAMPYGDGDPAFEAPADGMWSPVVLWTVFAIMLVAVIGTASIVVVKRKRMHDRSVEEGEE